MNIEVARSRGRRAWTRRHSSSRVARAVGQVLPSVHEWLDANSPGGLSYPRLRLLEALHCQGPAKMKTLGDALGLSARNMTAVADSLEGEGLLRRVAHPSDRRATLLELTADGQVAADQSLVPRLAEISRLFDELSPTARNDLRGNAGQAGLGDGIRLQRSKVRADNHGDLAGTRSPLGPRPVGAQRRSVERRRPAHHDSLGQARRRARVHPLLGGRTPQHAQCRVHVARRADRSPCCDHVEHPGRFWGSDVAQPCAPGDRRAVRDVGGSASRTHRPRHRACTGHRPTHRGRVAAHVGPARRGRLPSRLPRSHGTARRPAHVPAACGTTSTQHLSPRRRRRSSCSAPAGTAPSSPVISACRSPSLTTSTPAARCRPPSCTATRSDRRSCSTIRT